MYAKDLPGSIDLPLAQCFKSALSLREVALLA